MISGLVVNGTAGQPPPADLAVTLHVIDSNDAVNVRTANTDDEGRFLFEEVEVDSNSSYSIAATYQEVLYVSSADPTVLEDPVELTVYDGTATLDDVRVEAHVLLLVGDEGNKSLSGVEVVTLVNDSDRAYIPDLSQPINMDFLRFSLPRGSTGLDVGSNLSGGGTINVGIGFGFTAPVPPGSHQVTYSYHVPYDKSRIVLDYSFPMGADSFNVLMEDDLGSINDPRVLSSGAQTDVGGTLYSSWEASGFLPGEDLIIELVGLPRPTVWSRLGDSLTGGSSLKIGIPGGMAVVLAAVLVFVVARRRPETAPAGSPSLQGSTLDAVNAMEGHTNGVFESQRRALVEDIARLDGLFEAGNIELSEYQTQRQTSKMQLRQITRASVDEYVPDRGSRT